MKICEIFYSIQGEGRWTGLLNVFVRTSGCNLRCSYCDTKYAYEEGEEMSVKEVIDVVSGFNCRHVCITGGEPLLQDETELLIDKLLDRGYFICLETNGSRNIKKFVKHEPLVVSLDIKCPSSSMHREMLFENISFLKRKDQLKFVIKNKEDYLYAKKLLLRYKPVCPVFFQPVWGVNPEELASLILKDNLNVRLGLQIHKIIWGEKKRV